MGKSGPRKSKKAKKASKRGRPRSEDYDPDTMWPPSAIEGLASELNDWNNEAANRLADPLCDAQTYAELMDATVRALGVLQLTVARMPIKKAKDRDGPLWSLISETWQHDVTAALVGLGCDAVLWTRFMARATPETLADALAVCWVGYYTADRLTAMEDAKAREAVSDAEAPAPSTDERPETGGIYRPARWFRKGTAARLRMAARQDRKTKRVSTRRIDGVVCYAVADVARWWPDALPRTP